MASVVPYVKTQPPFDPESYKEYTEQQLRNIEAALRGFQTAWTPYTVTVAPFSGALTSYTASGSYKTFGKTTFFRVSITITTNGTAAGFLEVSLPAASPAGATDVIPGHENVISGKMLQGIIPSVTSSTMTVVTYDNLYPGGNGAVLLLSGSYESV